MLPHGDVDDQRDPQLVSMQRIRDYRVLSLTRTSISKLCLPRLMDHYRRNGRKTVRTRGGRLPEGHPPAGHILILSHSNGDNMYEKKNYTGIEMGK